MDRSDDLISAVSGLRSDVAELQRLGASRWGSPSAAGPWGVVGRAQATTNQAGITTIVDLTSLSVTFTAVTGRLYRTSFVVEVQVSAASTPIVAVADGSNNLKQQVFATYAAGAFGLLTGFAYETITGGSATRKLRGSVAAGTMTISAGATSPAQIVVEDIGPG